MLWEAQGLQWWLVQGLELPDPSTLPTGGPGSEEQSSLALSSVRFILLFTSLPQLVLGSVPSPAAPHKVMHVTERGDRSLC